MLRSALTYISQNNLVPPLSHVAVTAILFAHGPLPPKLFGTLLVATLTPAFPATILQLSFGKMFATSKLQPTPGTLKYAKHAPNT